MRRLHIILRHALAFRVHQPEAKLGGSIAMVGGEAKPFDGFGVVAQPIARAVMDQPDERLSADITLFGERPRKLQRRCLIAIAKSRHGGAGIVHRGRETQRRDSIGHGFHEPIAGGAKHEPERQDESGAGGSQRAPNGGRTSSDSLFRERRLQHSYLFLQGRDMRPTCSESMPPSHVSCPSKRQFVGGLARFRLVGRRRSPAAHALFGARGSYSEWRRPIMAKPLPAAAQFFAVPLVPVV
jgi:hypothetical protein